MNSHPEEEGSVNRLSASRSRRPDTSAELASYRLAAIVESAGDAIISKTLEGIVVSWNKGAERVFGYTEDEMIGQPIARLIPLDHQDEEPQILARLRRGEKIEHYETIRAHKDGHLLDISLTVSPIRDAKGNIIGASKIARDITESKRSKAHLQRALAEAEEAKRQAEEANRLKDEFLTTISHELRTPLTAVVGWTSMLRDGGLDDDMAQKALDTIDRNVKAQAPLIEDLLDISRIVSGKMRIETKPLNLADTIRSAVDSIMPAAEAKNIRLQMVIDAATGSVIGDSDRLQQVIWNLLANAVKFTPFGGRVWIEMERTETDTAITVRDNGIGINPEFLPYIFDRFSQQDTSSTRSYGGLGMGLAIVKYIVELHGGAIRAFSEGTGTGASFTVTLPRLQQKAGIVEPPPAGRQDLRLRCSEQTAELAGLSILVVDDEADTCEMLETALEQCGATVRTADSALRALAELEAWQPDLLIADINMPQLDGFQLIHQIRDRGIKIPAIALTALARIEDRVKVLASGYQMHVAKPVELPELYAVVASLAIVTKKPVSTPCP